MKSYNSRRNLDNPIILVFEKPFLKMTPKTDAEKQALAQQQAQLAALAKTDPDKAAQLQVAAVKKALNIK